jgi:hypothetical protein
MYYLMGIFLRKITLHAWHIVGGSGKGKEKETQKQTAKKR